MPQFQPKQVSRNSIGKILTWVGAVGAVVAVVAVASRSAEGTTDERLKFKLLNRRLGT